jgi:hypothetical protein
MANDAQQMSDIEIRDIYGLVEPTLRRYIHQELDLWYDMVGDYTEYQLRSVIGGGGEDDSEDDDESDDDEESRESDADGDAGTVISLLREFPETVGKLFLSFLCNPKFDVLILWLSGGEFLMCQGPDSHGNDHRDSLPYHLEQMNAHGDFSADATFEGRRHSFTIISCKQEVTGHDWGTALLLLCSRIDAVSLIDCSHPRVSSHDLAELVSRVPPGGRTINFCRYDPPPATARVLASRCHPDLTLVVHLDGWKRKVSILAKAMVANRCPRRLIFENPEGRIPKLAEALRSTTRVEDVTILSSYRTATDECFEEMLDAIGQNHGIRTLAVHQRSGVTSNRLRTLWRSVMTSPTLESINVACMELRDEHNFTDAERRECAEVVVSVLQSNAVLTQIKYNRETHNEEVMEKQVVPLLHLNRFRPVAKALEGMSASERERTLSALVGSDLVRGRAYLFNRLVASMIKESMVVPCKRGRPQDAASSEDQYITSSK